MELIDEHKSFGGWQRRYKHQSSKCQCEMTFSLYLPPQVATERVPVVYWLSGLTCTDENFVNKAGAQRAASELGLALVAPDTSPRGAEVPDRDQFDLGQGAAFYVNATQDPWATNYQMYDYLVQELPLQLGAAFGEHELIMGREAIAGHSMGGHGALAIGLNEGERYAGIVAFSPVCAPTAVPWGQQAFPLYLGDNQALWQQYDACELLRCAPAAASLPPIQVEQGLADNFLDEQLRPDLIEEAARETGADVVVNRREGYDHSYFFIASFIEQQLKFLREQLDQKPLPDT
ncbi:S-formylglutathione hydrolase [Salinisphaera sp. USBA-960]|uniref:S-formylglutathione hydrolase n=1 Tax=Salinisphaera orenii TaxID=856731 RepID=UPI000DBE9811|nr:S-formylglutathione hydrolase [Salifodinibacter halophilus]NNC26868.1 S-formylglutathione hydrolase [Salifodinibacter halophilus]